MRPYQNLDYPSLLEYAPLFNTYMRHSQYLHLPPRIYPPPLLNNYNIMRPSQNIPLPPRIRPPPFHQLYAKFPGSTSPSQNIPPPFKQLCAKLPRPTPPSQNIPHFSTNLYVWTSQNLPVNPRINPHFQQIYMCDPPIIYPSLPEYFSVLGAIGRFSHSYM